VAQALKTAFGWDLSMFRLARFPFLSTARQASLSRVPNFLHNRGAPLHRGNAHDTFDVRSISMAAFAGSVLVLLASNKSSSVGRPIAAEGLRRGEQSLSVDDERRLRGAMDEVVATLMQLIDAPSASWDDCKSQHISGLGEVLMHAKKIPGYDGRMYMGVGVFEDVSFEELVVVTAAHEGAAKLSFDPTLKSFESIFEFSTSWGGKARLLRTQTKPMVYGLISSRDVNSVSFDTVLLQNGRAMSGAMGLQSPRIVPHIDDSPVLMGLRDEPPARGAVVAIDHLSGYVHEPMGALPGGRGSWRVHYILHSSAGGSVPAWAAEKGVSQAIASWFGAAHKHVQQMRTT